MGLANTNPLRAAQVEQYLVDLEYLARIDAGAVTQIGPNYGTDLPCARTGNGVYTYTFPQHLRPLIVRGWANVVGASNVTANVTYVPATGVVTIRQWAQGGAADNTAVQVQVFLLCSRTKATK